MSGEIGKVLTADREKRGREIRQEWRILFNENRASDEKTAELAVRLLYKTAAAQDQDLNAAASPTIIWANSPTEALGMAVVHAMEKAASTATVLNSSDFILRAISALQKFNYRDVSGPASSFLHSTERDTSALGREFCGLVVDDFWNDERQLDDTAPIRELLSPTYNGQPMRLLDFFSKMAGASPTEQNEIEHGRLDAEHFKILDRVILRGMHKYLESARTVYQSTLEAWGKAATMETYRDVFEIYEDEDLLTYLTILLTNTHGWLSTNDTVWLVRRAGEISRDDINRLHGEGKPAINFPGHPIYYWHGVRITERVAMHPETITVEDIQTEPNAEVQRVMVHLYGPEKYIQDLGIEKRQEDRYGELYIANDRFGRRLYAAVKVLNRTPEGHWEDDPNWPKGVYEIKKAEYVPAMGDVIIPEDEESANDNYADEDEPPHDALAANTAVLAAVKEETVKVWKPGQKFVPLLDEKGQYIYKPYWLPVPPDTRSAHEGVAWSFGKSTWEYDPIAES